MRAAAGFVRQGAVFADIGTDHAYLPVFLLEEGKIAHAYASDINEGPLKSAKRHIEESGHADRVTLVLTDGLTGLEGHGITDVAVCGMGGELIADILTAAPFVKDSSIRLILQPMTRAAHLRRTLAKEGFAIVDECVTEAAGKLYFCMAAAYTGVPYMLSRVEEELGAVNIARKPREDCFLRMIDKKIAAARRRLAGYAKASRTDKDEEDYLAALYAIRREGP